MIKETKEERYKHKVDNYYKYNKNTKCISCNKMAEGMIIKRAKLLCGFCDKCKNIGLIEDNNYFYIYFKENRQ